MQGDYREFYFSHFPGTQTTLETSTQLYLHPSARCKDEKYPVFVVYIFQINLFISLVGYASTYAICMLLAVGDFWESFTAALIETISMLHQRRAVFSNDAKPSVVSIICG